ncbi:hypothetical protein DRE_00715 [Drechslerella stenobrocha 248]|uniref:Rhamnogalacturonase A/B/Epimerase-like pectate lyase domain-containing protein n=1 Tax=Drechslerella stenobrocha 248 TaxID=1043628 RepID=W7HMS7_9PEZI|nr:hypothetical protein DRE_00715 [Drechslerella stenobrocha 248]
MYDRRDRSFSDASGDDSLYGSPVKPTGFMNKRVRIYTILTLGSIFCYMYYIFQSSSFHGYRGWIYDASGSPPNADISPPPAVAHTSVVEVDVTKVISTAFGPAPTASPSAFWLANMEHRGIAPYHSDKDYKGMRFTLFRNVLDYGAKGDGLTDDTEAINSAISSGSRCGQGCDSSTISPALVYFPPGRYRVSAPIVATYYTQLVGNPLDLPVLLAASNFKGMAVIDTDPYGPLGQNWYINQNNFFRAIRNFVIDLTDMNPTEGVGIHHQVAQATSIYNVVFKMHEGAATRQKGIFMDNGSGGFLSTLKFYGGEFGAYFGNQQFTTIDLEFHNCKTAIYVNWDWVWLLKSIRIYDCAIGVDISSGGPDKLGVGSVLLLDSYIENTPTGIRTFRTPNSTPPAGGTLVLQNLMISGVDTTVLGWGDDKIFGGNEQGRKTTIPFWGHGKGYSYDLTNGTDINVVADDTVDAIPAALKDSAGKILERPRPLYRNIPANRFVSVKANGAIGDGKADDSVAIQKIINEHGNTPPGQDKKIIFFDYGVYLVSQTIYVPPNTHIVGESWSVIMSSGTTFKDADNPKPVFQVGKPGEEGVVEISDMLFQTQGPAAGAILMEWNIRSPPGEKVSGMWDVHFRVGGSHGTQLQSNTCLKTPGGDNHAKIDDDCVSAFMLLHIGKTASLLMENMWLWTSDHDLDADDHGQISIYTGRGLLCEAETGPVWMYGHAVEHNVLYNYQLVDTKNIFMGVIQTETPYFQSNPRAREPFPPLPGWHDPDLVASCASMPNIADDKIPLCEKSWGLRILNSSDVFAFGAGLYSFFEDYDTACIEERACQYTMVMVEGVRMSETVPTRNNIWLMGLNTIGTENMVAWSRADGEIVEVKATDGNRNSFSDTVGLILL